MEGLQPKVRESHHLTATSSSKMDVSLLFHHMSYIKNEGDHLTMTTPPVSDLICRM